MGLSARRITEGLETLAGVDADLAAALNSLGPPPPRRRPAGFETLLTAIISQQISKQAAAAILARVQALLPEMSAAALLTLEEPVLARAGLSRRKVEYARGLAEAVAGGALDIPQLATLSDEDAIAAITALRGFGRWSAEIYLLFSLGRPDVFPAEDLALRVALGRLKGLTERPSAAQARALVAPWRPCRSAGSLFLWHYYRAAPLDA